MIEAGASDADASRGALRPEWRFLADACRAMSEGPQRP